MATERSDPTFAAMQMSLPATATGATRAATFHLRPGYRRWIYVLAAASVGLGALLVGVFLSVLGTVDFVTPFVVLAAVAVIVFGGVALVIVRAGRRISVSLSAEGVEYRAVGYRLVAPWSEVESLGTVILAALSGAGLTLKSSAVAPGGGWIRIANLMDLQALWGPGYDRVVPLVQFADPLAGSTLLEELRRHIPEVVARYEDRRDR